MRFLLLAGAFLAATPLLSKLIAAPPGDAGRKPSLEDCPPPMDASPKRSAEDCPSPGFTLKHFKEILLAVWHGMSDHGDSLLAAGVAFYALFAIFPALGAATWIFGLLANPKTIHDQLENLRSILPAEAWQVINRQLVALTSQSTSLSLAGIGSLLVALYSARLAASSMMQALNSVFGVKETRSFLVTNGLAILFTIVGIAILLIAVGVLVGVPIFFSYVGIKGSVAADIIRYARWPASRYHNGAGACADIPVRAGPGECLLEVAELGVGSCDGAVAARFLRIFLVCFRLQFVRQDLWLHRSGRHPLVLVLADCFHRPAGRGTRQCHRAQGRGLTRRVPVWGEGLARGERP